MFADSEEEEEEDKGKSDPAAKQLAKSMMSNMYNTRMVNWSPMATFGESTEVLSEALPLANLLKSKKGKVADENRAAATSNVQQADLDDVQRKQRELGRATDEKNKEARKGWFGYDTNKIFNRRGQMLVGCNRY